MKVHVKAAASSMLSELESLTDECVEVGRIDNDSETISYIRNVVNMFTSALIAEKLITDRPPKFTLGSTRLIAHELGAFDAPSSIETRAIYDKAMSIKSSFGDIDVDVEMTGTPKDVGECLKKRFPNEVAYKLCGSYEVNVGYMSSYWNPYQIIQIDFVDVKTNRIQKEYNQFSSWIDITLGIKGLLRDILATSITKTQPVDPDTKLRFQQDLKENKDLVYQVCKAKEGDVLVLEDVRWSLGHEYLKLIAIYRKIDKNGKELKTAFNVEGADIFPGDDHIDQSYYAVLYHQSFNDDYGDIEPLSRISREIGLDEGWRMYHSVYMLEYIKNFEQPRRQAIWDQVIKTLNRKRPTATAGGQLSNEEADKTVEFMKPYFEGVTYDRTND